MLGIDMAKDPIYDSNKIYEKYRYNNEQFASSRERRLYGIKEDLNNRRELPCCH